MEFGIGRRRPVLFHCRSAPNPPNAARLGSPSAVPSRDVPFLLLPLAVLAGFGRASRCRWTDNSFPVPPKRDHRSPSIEESADVAVLRPSEPQKSAIYSGSCVPATVASYIVAIRFEDLNNLKIPYVTADTPDCRGTLTV